MTKIEKGCLVRIKLNGFHKLDRALLNFDGKVGEVRCCENNYVTVIVDGLNGAPFLHVTEVEYVAGPLEFIPA